MDRTCDRWDRMGKLRGEIKKCGQISFRPKFFGGMERLGFDKKNDSVMNVHAKPWSHSR